MQIPKQPRTKPPAPAEAETQSGGGQSSASTTEDLNKQLQEAYSAYVRNINAASLHAHLEYAKAYLTYLNAVQQTPSDTAAALDFWKDILSGHDQAQAVGDAYKKAAQASIDQQVNMRKTLADAASAYSHATREVWEKLQDDLAQHNKEIGDALKEALLKVDVGPANLPALSLLYQSLRSMSAPLPGGTAKPV